MPLFGPPDIEKLTVKRDRKGLMKALGYEKDSWVRTAAAEALGQIGDARAVDSLIAALKVKDRDARKAAAAGLLVAVYRSGELDEAQKAALLAQRAVIKESHQDFVPPSDRSTHTDRGTGVDFPV